MRATDSAMPSSRIHGGLLAVVAALPEEVAPLCHLLESAGIERLDNGRARVGNLADRPVVVATTGDGAHRASAGISEVLERYRVERLIVLGIAGGLSPDLNVGDIVAATMVLDSSGAIGVPDASLLSMAGDLEGVQKGVVYSHALIAVDALAKERLWHSVGGRQRTVVDLESASFVRAAVARGVPFLVLRSVSDSYEEALPLDFNRFRRADGSSDRLRILGHALRRPSIIPELLQLRDRLRVCARRLAHCVEELVV